MYSKDKAPTIYVAIIIILILLTDSQRERRLQRRIPTTRTPLLSSHEMPTLHEDAGPASVWFTRPTTARHESSLRLPGPSGHVSSPLPPGHAR